VTDPLLFPGLVVLGLGLLLGGGWAIARRWEERGQGALVYVDAGASRPLLRAPRYRLSGRPDEVRRRRDGRSVPVEWKSGPTPRSGPPASHRVQLLAYCLLLEELEGVSPAGARLRYGDGGEFDLAWDASARAEVLGLLAAIRRPYEGEALPAPRKCPHCRWYRGCDARAPGLG
jgi:CRISPR-associated exonuclease Cas4